MLFLAEMKTKMTTTKISSSFPDTCEPIFQLNKLAQFVFLPTFFPPESVNLIVWLLP